MSFQLIKQEFQQNFNKINLNNYPLFVVDFDRNELWENYLTSFPEGTNEIHKERREYDCQHCKQFIRQFGGLVAITPEFERISIWDLQSHDSTFNTVYTLMSNYVSNKVTDNIFLSPFAKAGINENNCLLESGIIQTWHHFALDIPDKYVVKNSTNLNERLSNTKSLKGVFERGLKELTPESLSTVLDLIYEQVLYKGDEWKFTLEKFISLQTKYNQLSENKKDNFIWFMLGNEPISVTRLRNTSMGTLLIDLSNGIDIESAVRKFELVVAPQNYKRSKTIISPSMIRNAEEKINELGLIDSLSRRHATIDDLKVSDVLYIDRDKRQYSLFDDLVTESMVSVDKIQNMSGIDVEEFVNDILPKSQTVEYYFDNNHENNLFTLITSTNSNSKPLFKWPNNFSWAYNGNVTDSLKQRVQKAGGKVDGVLRFSIQWNMDSNNPSDFDAHCIEPCGNHIYFAHKINKYTLGNLDVDIIDPEPNIVPVENITWATLGKMNNGIYDFWVHNYTKRGKGGFVAEIEFDGNIYEFNYPNDLPNDVTIKVAKVTLRNGKFTLTPILSPRASQKQVWGLSTNNFYKVNSVFLSPNYWDSETGNKHYFFAIDKCKITDSLNGFYNEFLRQDLNKHRKVFEALSSKMKVPYSDNQLSGVGFSSTVRNTVLFRVDNKIYKVIV